MNKLKLIFASLLLSTSAFGASMIGIEPPSNLIVTRGGLEWVYAAPCDPGGCGTITLDHDFRFANESEWLSSFSSLADLANAFTLPDVKCAAAYFSNQHDHCDASDISVGYVWNSPFGLQDTQGIGETFLVRGQSAPAVPEPSTFALLASGMAAAAGFRFRRK